jgi:hypothetical protein
LSTVAHDRDEHLVAVGEDVGGHRHGFAHRSLDRKAAAVHVRADVLDDDAAGEPFGGWSFERGRRAASIL